MAAPTEQVRISQRRAKILCTLGPAVDSDDAVRELIKHGMDAARLNLSYGVREEHVRHIQRVRRVSEELGRHIGIIADIPGPKVRIGKLENGTAELREGERVELRPIDDTLGNERSIPVDQRMFHDELIRGDRILLSDGSMELRVTKVEEGSVEVDVITGGQIHDRTDVHLPGLPLRSSVLTEADTTHLEMAIEQDVDFIALTYVRDANDVIEAREKLDRMGRVIPIVAKVERSEAFSRLDGILGRADGIMIRRGDLGAELELSRVPIVQKEAVRLANNRGVPVVIGTQMLGSMVDRPNPTRAEASDVSNAIADGADVVSLAAETAIGKYPIEAVAMMDRIIRETETETFKLDRVHELISYPSPFPDTTARMACRAAVECNAALIACFTKSGNTAGLVAKYRPEVPIVAFCPDESTKRRLSFHWGVQVATLEAVTRTEEMISHVDEKLLNAGAVSPGDRIVIVFGAPVGEMGHTNSVRLHQVGSYD